MNNVKAIQRINEKELSLDGGVSWHDQYKNSAYVFIGGLQFDLTEGDIISVFSQYGEVVDINLVRDKKSSKSKGYCFLAYEDQRSTVLAVDNFNGIKLLNRTIRVDHVKDYKPPKDEDGNIIPDTHCAPKTPSSSETEEPKEDLRVYKEKKKHRKRMTADKKQIVDEHRNRDQEKRSSSKNANQKRPAETDPTDRIHSYSRSDKNRRRDREYSYDYRRDHQNDSGHSRYSGGRLQATKRNSADDFKASREDAKKRRKDDVRSNKS